MNKQNEYDLFYVIYSCENEILIVLMVIYFAIMWLQVLHSTVVKQLEIADLLEKLKESDRHVSIRAAFFFFLLILNSYSHHQKTNSVPFLQHH